MLAIFDMSSVNITRYNSELLKGYSGKYIAYVDDPNWCVDIPGQEVTQLCSGGWSIKKIIQSFQEYQVSVVVISGQRPADYRVIIAANELKLPIVYKMHGLYVEHVMRQASFYFLNIKKVYRTLGYLMDIMLFTKSVRISGGIFCSFVFGLDRKAWMLTDELRVDYGLVWSEFWESWHERHWVMSPRKGWGITGNPDTIKFVNIQAENNSFCYVYQTLVEDGRVSGATMDSFYDELARVAKNQGLIVNVKWHVRGDATIKKGLENRGFNVLAELPVGQLYVGHSSSLLGLIPLLGGSLIIFELDGLETPKQVEECATLVTSNVDILAEGLQLKYDVDERLRSKAIYYFGGEYSQEVEGAIIGQYCDK